MSSFEEVSMPPGGRCSPLDSQLAFAGDSQPSSTCEAILLREFET